MIVKSHEADRYVASPPKGLTLALVYVAAMGVFGAVNWILLVSCCVAGVTGIVWGFYYARTEGEAAK